MPTLVARAGNGAYLGLSIVDSSGDNPNAALIAAAPEMREMLLKLETHGEFNSCVFCGYMQSKSGPHKHNEDVGCTLGTLLERIR